MWGAHKSCHSNVTTNVCMLIQIISLSEKHQNLHNETYLFVKTALCKGQKNHLVLSETGNLINKLLIRDLHFLRGSSTS